MRTMLGFLGWGCPKELAAETARATATSAAIIDFVFINLSWVPLLFESGKLFSGFHSQAIAVTLKLPREDSCRCYNESREDWSACCFSAVDSRRTTHRPNESSGSSQSLSACVEGHAAFRPSLPTQKVNK